MKKICMVTVLALVVAGCQGQQDTQAPVGPNATPAAKPASAKPSASPAKPAEVKSAAESLSLNPPKVSSDNVFTDVKSCMDAKYTQEQCTQGYNVAFAMHTNDAPKFDTKEACQAIFKLCLVPAQSTSKKFVPQMEGFTVAGQPKGQSVKPSAEKPLFLTPLYRGADGKLGRLITQNDKPSIDPIR